MLKAISRINLLAVIGFIAFALPVQAQIFDDPENLQVLPENTDPATLRNIMRGFSLGTGIRCTSCHVGEENQPLSSYDFASDDNELKQKAREMLKMVNAINDDHLGKFGDDRVVVQCVTCHRGVPKPRQIGEELAMAGEEGGVDGLKERYRELRGTYYGTHSYDFGEFAISEVARGRAAAGETDQARAVLDLMLEDNSDSFNAHFLYGELKQMSGDIDGALKSYREALRINPEAGFVERRIAEITAPQETESND